MSHPPQRKLSLTPSPQLGLCPSYVISESPPNIKLNMLYYNQLLPCLSLPLDYKHLEDRGKVILFISLCLMHSYSGRSIIIFGTNIWPGKTDKANQFKNLTGVLRRIKSIFIKYLE